ncbi:hypothetical protein [Microbacterium sp. 69-10]|uniref:hypothetical protein n=1 Tax=Microbacterium sp. 69-10 TaxID=1895783 RepID=UPI0025F85BC3|nr:hypothetical protein [Microbacterium sp. 69-10]
MRSGLRRVVFWDFDGTLAVRDGMWSGAVIDALRSVDPDTALDAAQVRPYLGEGFPWHTPKIVDAPPLSATAWSRRLVPVFARALTKNGIPEDLATAASARALTEYYRVDPWSLIAGAADALQLTRAAGYDNVILSNHRSRSRVDGRPNLRSSSPWRRIQPTRLRDRADLRRSAAR